MARFYARIQGSRGEATRMGDKSSGIEGHVSGWNVGVKVYISVNERGEDEVTVYATGGSNDSEGKIQIANFTRDDFKKGLVQSVA